MTDDELLDAACRGLRACVDLGIGRYTVKQVAYACFAGVGVTRWTHGRVAEMVRLWKPGSRASHDTIATLHWRYRQDVDTGLEGQHPRLPDPPMGRPKGRPTGRSQPSVWVVQVRMPASVPGHGDRVTLWHEHGDALSTAILAVGGRAFNLVLGADGAALLVEPDGRWVSVSRLDVADRLTS